MQILDKMNCNEVRQTGRKPLPDLRYYKTCKSNVLSDNNRFCLISGFENINSGGESGELRLKTLSFQQ